MDTSIQASFEEHVSLLEDASPSSPVVTSTHETDQHDLQGSDIKTPRTKYEITDSFEEIRMLDRRAGLDGPRRWERSSTWKDYEYTTPEPSTVPQRKPEETARLIQWAADMTDIVSSAFRRRVPQDSETQSDSEADTSSSDEDDASDHDESPSKREKRNMFGQTLAQVEEIRKRKRDSIKGYNDRGRDTIMVDEAISLDSNSSTSEEPRKRVRWQLDES
jgi:hypothetical protein